MNRSAPAARAAMPENLSLPIEAPREAWPALIERAADQLAGVNPIGSAVLALELRAIAEALRVDRVMRAARALAADAGLCHIDCDDPRLLSLAALVRGGAA